MAVGFKPAESDDRYGPTPLPHMSLKNGQFTRDRRGSLRAPLTPDVSGRRSSSNPRAHRHVASNVRLAGKARVIY